MELYKLDAMLDALENDLPGLMRAHPDADGADFWMAFAVRTSEIERTAGPAHTTHARYRLDRMLDSRGLIPMPPEQELPDDDAAIQSSAAPA